MAGTIQIKYADVYGKTAELRNQITTELDSMENSYRQIQSMLDDLDGATNAALKEAMEANRQKTLMAAKTLDKLLAFMANSSRQIEASERKIAHVFESFTSLKGGAR